MHPLMMETIACMWHPWMMHLCGVYGSLLLLSDLLHPYIYISLCLLTTLINAFASEEKKESFRIENALNLTH